MAMLIGGIIGFWLIYAIIALFAKHKISLIVTFVLGIISGIASLLAKGDYFSLISSVLAVIIIFLLVPIQVNSEAKEEWKRLRKK